MSRFLSPGEYLPHQAPMILLEEVIAVSSETATCRSTVSLQGVLSPFLTEDHRLPGWYALELMAQTVGVWNGWHRQQHSVCTPALGMILGARNLTTTQPFFGVGDSLDIQISLLMQDGRMASFDAAIYQQKNRVAQGRVNTYQPNDDELAYFFKEEKEHDKTSPNHRSK